jgi:hypothetical protein
MPSTVSPSTVPTLDAAPRRTHRWGRWAAPVVLSLSLVAVAAAAETPALAPTKTWAVDGDFAKRAADEPSYTRARMNLSGAACAPTRPRLTSCLIISDEKKYAQFFSIQKRTLRPGTLIQLTGKDVKGDPDAEGAAFADGFFYVIGSHGRARHRDQEALSRFIVLRFPTDPRGRPAFAVSEDDVVGVAASTRLSEAMREADGVGPFFDMPLGENGVNIEGIAVRDGRMHLGFRGPSVDGQAFVLSADAEAVFTPDQPLHPTVTRLPLGPTTGIRDLAAVRDGLLLLTGPVNDQAVTPALLHWNDKTGALTPLGALLPPKNMPAGAKAETVLVLRDAPGKPLHLLIMYDGAENGFPTEYRVKR